jgi:hypothetical protein
LAGCLLLRLALADAVAHTLQQALYACLHFRVGSQAPPATLTQFLTHLQ